MRVSAYNPSALDAQLKKTGMSQAQLERQADLANGSISRWKKDGSTPRLETLQRLAEILRCSLADLLIDKGG